MYEIIPVAKFRFSVGLGRPWAARRRHQALDFAWKIYGKKYIPCVAYVGIIFLNNNACQICLIQ